MHVYLHRMDIDTIDTEFWNFFPDNSRYMTKLGFKTAERYIERKTPPIFVISPINVT